MNRPGRRGLLSSEPFLLLAVVLLVLYFAREILMPFALALTLNFLLAPIVMALQKLKMARLPAVLLVVILSALGVAAVGYIVSTQLIDIAEDLGQYRLNVHNRIAALHAPTSGPIAKAIKSLQEIDQEFSGVTGTTPPAPDVSAPKRRVAPTATPKAASANTLPAASVVPTPVTVVEGEKGPIRELRDLLIPVGKPLGEAGIVMIFTIYMLVKREDLRNRLLLLAGMGHMNLMTQALNDAADRISRYLVMNFLVNAGYGVVFGLGLFAIGVPNATLWGAVAGILRVVPYVGTMVGAMLPLIFSLVITTTWWHPVLVLALFVTLEMILSNFLEPLIYGSHTGISPLALVTMAILWTMIWGWPGLVLSTPLTVCLIVMGRYVPQMSFLHILLGDEVALAPEAKFYERLLALDDTEAHAIAEQYLEGKQLIELYDGVLLPSLSLAEQDRHKGALDEVRAEFLFHSVLELIAEFTDYSSKVVAAPQQFNAATVGRKFPIVCVSASDEADEIAATMLAQLLEQEGSRTMMLPAAALSPEILTRLAEEAETMICISALPPFAFAQSRALCQRIREQLPNNRILVCLWGSPSEPERTRERYGRTRPDKVVLTLTLAMEQIREWQKSYQAEPAVALQAQRS
ncbi:MAG TPA: AI-2E family transporter [Acidisarcina sp.]